jgi:hypothetical protein
MINEIEVDIGPPEIDMPRAAETAPNEDFKSLYDEAFARFGARCLSRPRSFAC